MGSRAGAGRTLSLSRLLLLARICRRAGAGEFRVGESRSERYLQSSSGSARTSGSGEKSFYKHPHQGSTRPDSLDLRLRAQCRRLSSPGATKAKELDFKAYVEWRLQTSPAMFCNYQVHFCTRSEEPRRRPIGREELEKAIAHLDAISIVGTVARYDDWIALAQKILSRPFPNFVLQSSRRNVTAAQRSEPAILDQLMDDLGESTTNFLLEHNQLDMCLHQIADSILTRRMAEEGVELMLARAYTRARQNRRSGREEIAHPLS